MFEKIRKTAEFIKEKVISGGFEQPNLLITLGSGLGYFAENTEKLLVLPYSDIPGFPSSTVQGHAGRLILARDKKTGKNFWIMQGRVHYYEGYSMNDVVFPLRVLIVLGIKKFIVTNAAGGVNRNFEAGDLMIIRDHINMMGSNPLIGRNIEEFGTRFPDMTFAYSRKLGILMQKSAIENGITMKEGVYLALSGPTFETPAEVRMVSALGADAVGMSTVPEVIAAKHAGLEVAGVSFISNKAAGLSSGPLTHEEVSENAALVEKRFGALMERFISLVLEEKDG
ncbi:MAG TPA: purine-nucleoside phosphorylase [bacterium]|jgi:purine-nucleoside phosphorylase|nr:purine-nucleoside phosphorylase [bacterium]HNZ53909.1 purine-nucleoside phosphorylase [bacterium]HOG43216.1 purine-nucleoside phosphorylase [bacterium]HPM47695.1 purine-nucleoside phosphorylase [bacterium]HPY13722.1 purine-nucleoside phosphorylase [bacterium]